MGLTLTQFKYRHKDKKGLISIGIRLRFEGRHMEFPVKQIDGSTYKILEREYNEQSPTTQYLIEYWKDLYRTSFENLEKRGRDMSLLSRETLLKEVSLIEGNRFKNKVQSIVGFDISLENQEEVERRVAESFQEEEFIDEDDYLYAFGIIQSEVEREQAEKDFLNRKKIGKAAERSLVEYQKFGVDRSSIILSIGELFLKRKKNGDPLFISHYRGILKDIYAYQYDRQASDEIEALSEGYFDDFIRYMITDGIIKSSLNATPHELKYCQKDEFFDKQERQVMRKDTFKDKIKSLNKIIKSLRSMHSFDYFDNLNFNDYLSKEVVDNVGSRREESLNPKELQTLLNYSTDDQNKRISLDIFLIMIYAGGLRGYRPNLLRINKEEMTFKFFHGKRKNEVINPILLEIIPTLKRYNWIAPKKPSNLNITENLIEIARELNFDRRIDYFNTDVNRSESDDFYKPQILHDCISLRFARKTAVNYLLSKGLSREEVIAFTAHADPTILKHYVSGVNIEEKRKLLGL